MLLFWGCHPGYFPLLTHHQRIDLFATKKQPTYRGQWSSSRRRSQQNTPTLLIGQSSNFGFFLLVFFDGIFAVWVFCRFFVWPIFWFVPSTHWLIHCFRGSLDGINWWKKTPIFGSCSGRPWKEIFTNRIPFPFSIKGSEKIPSFLKSCQNWGPKKRSSVYLGRWLNIPAHNWLFFFRDRSWFHGLLKSLHNCLGTLNIHL